LADIGSASGIRLEGAVSADGTNEGALLGQADSVGDFNGDGIDDIAIEALAQYGTKVFVIFGRTAPFSSVVKLSSLKVGEGVVIDSYPATVSNLDVHGAGDVNGDGLGDIVIGAPQAISDGYRLGNGAAFIVFGRRTPFPPQMSLRSLDGSNGFRVNGNGEAHGIADVVSAAGDVNGDGFDDVLIGASDLSAGDGAIDVVSPTCYTARAAHTRQRRNWQICRPAVSRCSTVNTTST
jgi:hypothetical protein